MMLTACSASEPPERTETPERSVLFEMGFDEPIDSSTRSLATEQDWAAARIVESKPGSLTSVPGKENGSRAVALPNPCAGGDCSYALVEVEDDDRLDPGDDDFTVSARVLMEPEDVAEGSNVLQKGRYDTSGGQWKLQVDGEEGYPSCILQSDGIEGRKISDVVSETSVADGSWHDVSCQRLDDKLTVTVDGDATSVSTNVGPISNGEPLRVGAAGINKGDDQFHGAIDEVRFCIPTCA